MFENDYEKKKKERKKVDWTRTAYIKETEFGAVGVACEASCIVKPTPG